MLPWILPARTDGQWWVLPIARKRLGSRLCAGDRTSFPTFYPTLSELERFVPSLIYPSGNGIAHQATQRDNPRIVLLTPTYNGLTSNTYIARYLASRWCRSDLTVRKRRSYLKTVEGLEK